MATTAPPDPPAQRTYRAACPNCGAPVEFRSAASAFAVCSFCQSTVVREGDALRKIGTAAALFDDHSPLQLGVAGRYQGLPFTLVGRLQYGTADGTWNEWHALFDDHGEQRPAWLSEDNGRYVFAFDAPPLAPPPPPAEAMVVGSDGVLAGQRWTVASIVRARLISAQGELPSPPNTSGEFMVVDLRNAQGEVATLDYSRPGPPAWSLGRPVALSELALTGLAEASEQTLQGRAIACPNCGAAIDVKLSTTRSVTCPQCRSVVDLTSAAQGDIGGALAHYAQANGAEPQIPLGSVGTLALDGPPLPWQVVGYVERATVPGAAAADSDEDNNDDDSDGTAEFWREYLLYHRTAGFAFLVDANDGWSWTVTLSGAPERFGEAVKWGGALYRRLYGYTGRVTYVVGEFYWPLARDQLTHNTDYTGTGPASQKRLNREATTGTAGEEIVWSGGETLSADAVRAAFRLAPAQAAALQRDVSPLSSGIDWRTIVLIVVVVLIVLALLSRCGSGAVVPIARSVGGSYGGYSSGGSHK